jgi:23S rRNA (adenine2030-N6)-methyltransferase
MKNKDSPFFYVETHAGAGSYPLDLRESLQMEEFRGGIGQLLEAETALPKPLLQLVHLTKKNNSLIYPGSPKIAQELLRPQDSMLLFEKSEEQCSLLRTNLNSNATIIMNDGYKGLANHARAAKSPPRAIVFMDPPYQFGSDTDQIARLSTFSELTGNRHDWLSGTLHQMP